MTENNSSLVASRLNKWAMDRSGGRMNLTDSLDRSEQAQSLRQRLVFRGDFGAVGVRKKIPGVDINYIEHRVPPSCSAKMLESTPQDSHSWIQNARWTG